MEASHQTMSVKEECCRYHLLAAASNVVACVLLIICSANGFTGRPIIATLPASSRIFATRPNMPSSPTIHSSSCLHESYYSYEDDDSSDDSSDEELFAALLQQKSKSRDTTAAATSISPDSTSQQFHEHYNHLANVTGPTPSIKPEEIIPFIMNALRNNDYPDKDSGLKLVWEFATDTTQYVFKNNITGE